MRLFAVSSVRGQAASLLCSRDTPRQMFPSGSSCFRKRWHRLAGCKLLTPHWCHTPNLKHSSMHLRLFYPRKKPGKHLCRQLVRDIRCLGPAAAFWGGGKTSTCSWWCSRPALCNWETGSKSPGRGGWRSRNLRNWKKHHL